MTEREPYSSHLVRTSIAISTAVLYQLLWYSDSNNNGYEFVIDIKCYFFFIYNNKQRLDKLDTVTSLKLFFVPTNFLTQQFMIFHRIYSYQHYGNHMYRAPFLYYWTKYWFINISNAISYCWYNYYNISTGYNETTKKDTVAQV